MGCSRTRSFSTARPRRSGDPAHARECLAEFRERYNQRRPHWALRPADGGDPHTPEEVYVLGHAIQIPKWQGWAKKAEAELDRLLEATG